MTLRRGTTARQETQSSPEPSSYNELTAALESADPPVRRYAARELLRFPGAGTILLNRFKREPENAVREAILTSLIRLDEPSVTKELAECLRSEDTTLRNEAIEALRELASSGDPSNSISPVVASLLVDSDPDVRIFAVNILESMRHPEVERWLIEVIERDPHVNVCATAVDLLCEVGTQAACEPLLRLRERFPSEAYVQFAADLALRRIREI
jgi:HEAT repeat protein